MVNMKLLNLSYDEADTYSREVVKTVYMDEKIENYILDIIFATRYPDQFGLDNLSPLISFGASPRGSINLATRRKFMLSSNEEVMLFQKM